MEAPSIPTFGLSDLEEAEFSQEMTEFNELIAQNPYDFSASIAIGKTFFRKNKFDKAVKAYNAAIEQINSYGEAFAKMSLSLENKNNLKDSTLISTMAKELNPEHAKAYYHLGLAYHAQGNQDEALSAFSTSVKFDPESCKASFRLSWSLYDQGDLERALASYIKVKKPPTDDLLSYYTLGIFLGRTDNIPQAIEACDFEIGYNPFNVQAFITKFFALCFQEKFGEAIELFNFAKDINHKETQAYSLFLDLIDNSMDSQIPNKNEGKVRADKKHVHLYFNIGLILDKQGFLDKAILAYQRVIEINTKYPDVFIKLGLVFQKQEYFEQAIESFRTASMVHPTSFKCYIHLAEALRDNNKTEEAAAAFRSAISIAPNNVEANYKLGLLLESQGKFEEATKIYEKVIQIDSFHGDAFVRLGHVSHARKDVIQAIIYFVTAIQFKPQDADIPYQLGIVFQEQGNIKEAINSFENAINLDPNFAKPYRNLGIARMNQGSLREAIDIFNKAINLDPESIISYCYRGRLFNQIGIEDQALADFNKAYELLSNKEQDLSVSTRKSHHIINQILGDDREKLLKKLAHLHKEALKTEGIVQNIQANKEMNQSKIDQFEDMKKDIRRLTVKVVDHIHHDFEVKEKDCSKEDVDYLKKEINELKEMNLKFQKMLLEQNEAFKKMSKVVEVSGLQDKAMVKERFMNLALENTEVFKYCKTFYWTLVNYFTAYRTLSTDLVDGNLDRDDTLMDKAVEKGYTCLIKLAGALGNGIPLVGNAIQLIDTAATYSIEAHKQHKLYRKTEIICKVLMLNDKANLILEEDLGLLCAKTALKVSDTKAQMISHSSNPFSKTSFGNKFDEKWKASFEKLKSLVLPAINLGDSPSIDMALADVAALLNGILRDHQSILSSKEPLDHQFAKIVTEADWSKLKSQSTNPKNPKDAEQCKECNMF